MKKILNLLIILAITLSIFTVTALASDGEAVTESGNATFFEQIYTQALLHSDKILSALAFLGSLLLAFAYKKGILPLIRGGLSAITNAVGTLKEESEKANEISEKALSEAKAKLEATEASLSELCLKLEMLEQELKEAKNEQTKANDVKMVLESQTELLYEIFMSSSIPAYLKESVGEKINAMKKKLNTGEADSNEQE